MKPQSRTVLITYSMLTRPHVKCNCSKLFRDHSILSHPAGSFARSRKNRHAQRGVGKHVCRATNMNAIASRKIANHSQRIVLCDEDRLTSLSLTSQIDVLGQDTCWRVNEFAQVYDFVSSRGKVSKRD